MRPLPYSGDIELISDMLEDLEALRLELNQEEQEDEQETWEDAA